MMFYIIWTRQNIHVNGNLLSFYCNINFITSLVYSLVSLPLMVTSLLQVYYMYTYIYNNVLSGYLQVVLFPYPVDVSWF